VVPPQDERALADAIVRYFDPAVRERLNAEARQSAAAQAFSWHQLVGAVEQAIAAPEH
jgi:glycosyltransferase involved in cell wall biosynthesis